MNLQSPNIESKGIYLPITTEMRSIANQFAQQQPTKEKAEQILLNTIAVSVINNYLNMLDIETNLSESDSWNPVMQLCNDTSDLEIVGVGKLECRPIRSNADSCQIPLEVRDLRIGYTIVKIDDSLKKAEILGFISQVTTERLSIANLRPLEVLIDRIHELLQNPIADNSLVNLGQWFNNIFNREWQAIESIFSPESLNLALGFRNANTPNFDESNLSIEDNGVTRAKTIDLGVQLGDRKIILLIKLVPETNNNIGVILQVHPQQNELYLSENLQLKVLETSGSVFMEVQARSQDNYIQLQFSGQFEEIFIVEIALENLSFSQKFKL